MKKNYFIQAAHLKHGALHRELGISPHKKIPMGLLTGISHTPVGEKFRGHRVTLKLKRRAVLAKNLRGFK